MQFKVDILLGEYLFSRKNVIFLYWQHINDLEIVATLIVLRRNYFVYHFYYTRHIIELPVEVTLFMVHSSLMPNLFL